MFKFYLPFYYLYFSRLKTKVDLISWIIIFIIPQFIVTYLYTSLNFTFYITIFILSQIIFNTLYEVGYMENDISTVKMEKNPTMRLDSIIYNYLQKNYLKIIIVRYITILLFSLLLLLLNYYFKLELNIVFFMIILIINRIFFYLHNNIRNRWNLLTFSVLAISKYIFPIVLFLNINIVFFIFFFFTLFPLLRIIEHSTHKRYLFINYAKLIGNHDIFRVIYYLLFLILISILSFDYKIISMTLVYYFFMYRFLSLILVKKGLYKRDNLKNKDLYIKE